ncbi:hypothetical protein [Catenulispora yoronensis]|uniref:hypothetical protein n=1 Tax=Catenulispora yoronensis TaxID=450799 RepID=UPI0031D60D10
MTEIVKLLREHADVRERSFDPIEASALRQVASEFERGIRTDYQFRAGYVVEPAWPEELR